MTDMKLCMSLDDLADKELGKGRRNGGGGRSKGRGRRDNTGPRRRQRNYKRRDNAAPYHRRGPRSNPDDAVWKHDMFENKGQVSGGSSSSYNNQDRSRASSGTRIKISDIQYDVGESELQELFGTVGTIKKVRVYYDKSGRSEGKAEITFESRDDAESAVKQYNGAKIDGKAMSIEILPDAPVRERRNNGGFRSRRGGRDNRGRNNRQNQRGNWNNSRKDGNNDVSMSDLKIKVSF